MLEAGAQVLGRYTLIQLLRKGPLAHTWKVRDAQGHDLLLKHLTLSATPDWKALELLEREAETLKQLNHPQIPQLVDFVREETDEDVSLYIVTTYIPAPSLEQRLQRGERYSLTQAISMAEQLLAIFQYLHEHSPPIIHRDIKPANLLWDDHGRVYLVDFGAVLGRFSPQGGSTIVGTYGYMAPEQFSGRALPASDLYSLGATLVHMLSAHAPAELPTQGLRLDYHAYVHIDPVFRQWLDRMLAPDPNDRFSSAAQALQALTHTPTSPQLPAPLPFLPGEGSQDGVTLVQQGDRLQVILRATSEVRMVELQIGLALMLVGMIGVVAWLGNADLYAANVLLSERLLAWGPMLSWIGTLCSGLGIHWSLHQQRHRSLTLTLSATDYILSDEHQTLAEGPLSDIHGWVPVKMPLPFGQQAFQLQALDADGQPLFTAEVPLSQAALNPLTQVLLPRTKPASDRLLNP